MNNIIQLQDMVNKLLGLDQYTLAVFIDLQNPFDLMQKQDLLFKQRNMGVTERTYQFIRDFLANQYMRVRVGDTLSEEVGVVNGTPQGSVILPLLFIVMINDIPTSRPFWVSFVSFC